MNGDLLLEANGEMFDQAVNRLIADGDDRGLLDVLGSLPSTVKRLRTKPEDRFDIGIPVTNACAAAAIALRRGRQGTVDSALDALLEAYRLGDVTAIGASDDDLRLWEETAGGLWALGAGAVQEEDWQAVRSIVARSPAEGHPHYQTWLRHAQVMSARGSFDPEADNVLNLCVQRLNVNPGFGFVEQPAAERERFLCAFDQLALLVARTLPGADWQSFFPSYAKYTVAHVEPLVFALRRENDMRTAIFPGSNEELRALLRDANESALLQASQYRYHDRSWIYEGFQDGRTWAFIRAGDMIEDWGPVR